MCLWLFHLGFILLGTLWVSWTWMAISFPNLGKFSTIISPSIFSCPFFLSSSFGTLMIQILRCWALSQRSLRLSSFLLILFPPLCLIYFHHSIFHLTYPLFCLNYSTTGSLQIAFDLSYFKLFIIGWLFFISSRSLLNISCIFSILVSSLFIFNSILLSIFWIFFTIIILNSFSSRLHISSLLFGLVGIYHVTSPAEHFSAFLFCLDCCVWGALSVGWMIIVPLYCGVWLLWVGLD